MQVLASFSFEQLKKNHKVENISVFNFITQELESYKTFDLSKILDKVYGRNKWRNSYALGTISTDNYAPIIKNQIFSNLKPYLAFDRADGKKFINKKQHSDGNISLGPYYLIWKNPKSIGNLKKVRDHWPYKVKEIFLFPKEPTSLQTMDKIALDGKETFINHCIACHSLKGVGGTKGGDLLKMINEKNLTDQYIKNYILNPRSINKQAKMPEFPIYLDDKENRIKRLLHYLKDRIKALKD